MPKVLLAIAVFALICATLSSSGFAEGANCTASAAFSFSGVARVLKPKLFFRGNNQQLTKAFVVKDDFVAVRNVKDNGTCALFINQRGQETVGWLESSGLQLLEDAEMQDLPNRWQLKRGSQTVTIALTAAGEHSSRFEARLTQQNQPAKSLIGLLSVRFYAFTLEAKLGAIPCRFSGVFTAGFMRIFSETASCSTFAAGVYSQIRR